MLVIVQTDPISKSAPKDVSATLKRQVASSAVDYFVCNWLLRLRLTARRSPGVRHECLLPILGKLINTSSSAEGSGAGAERSAYTACTG